MPSESPRTPSYRPHKPSGQAVVALDGRGPLAADGADADEVAFDRAIAEGSASGP